VTTTDFLFFSFPTNTSPAKAKSRPARLSGGYLSSFWGVDGCLRPRPELAADIDDQPGR
jgi:hypothetical protein